MFPVADADRDARAVHPAVIEKVRHRVGIAGLIFEVDVFGGVNEGLVVAEVELPRGTPGRPAGMDR